MGIGVGELWGTVNVEGVGKCVGVWGKAPIKKGVDKCGRVHEVSGEVCWGVGGGEWSFGKCGGGVGKCVGV